MPTIRIATFNCENLFCRPDALNLETWEEGRAVLEDVERLNELLREEVYTDPIKEEMIAILEKYNFDDTNMRPESRWFIVNQVRDKLFTVSKGKIKIAADGRLDWVGWVELTENNLTGEQVFNTGRVVQLVNADIQLLVEVDDRLALSRFNRQVLEEVLHMSPFRYNLLVDGNDPRNIDIGLLSRHPICSVRSHISDGELDSAIFSRDCPEFEIELPDGKRLWLLGNHLKSKGFGNPAENNARRLRQATRVREIYEEARQRSDFVAVAGDLNDFPGSPPLDPLLAQTDLRDVMTHPTYTALNSLPGTYDTCTQPEQKIDYLLLSPALWERVEKVNVERSGIYAPRAFKKAGIKIMDTVTSDDNAASDHAAVWVDLAL